MAMLSFTLFLTIMAWGFAAEKSVLFIYGIKKFTHSEQILTLYPTTLSSPIFLELKDPPTDVADISAIHYYEGTVFDKPVKAMWFYKQNTDALSKSAKFLPKAAATINTVDQKVFSLYVSSKGYNTSHYEGDLKLLYNHTVEFQKGIGRTLRYELVKTPTKDKIELKLPEELSQAEIKAVEIADISPIAIRSYNRTVEGTGFHRSVKTSFTFFYPSSVQNCKLFAIEPVLEYHFVETDFLAEIPGCKYWINDASDIELPSSVASQYLLSFEFPLKNGTVHNKFYSFESTLDGYKLKYAFPYHFRYQPVGVNPYEPVEVLNPLFYLACDKEISNTENSFEDLLRKYVLNATKANPLKYEKTEETWKGEIPTALQEERKFVAIMTLVVTLGSVVCLLYFLIKKLIQSHSKRDQSYLLMIDHVC
eukprot:TRINITY_DN88491_c0_g1_i1.p1 TRINITY_DN88491_c0_g1~~TRINITY_DN88491_c0_g1_i1.p1  ORF type:complete len:450 (-),score=36.30 TRINITY_DN88491_c0_g1_i1:54-1316(-)